MKELYESITAKICSMIEQGTKPWQIPWNVTGSGFSTMPMNASSKTYYRGTNVLLLWIRAQEAGFPSHQWLTFRQARELGGNVVRGEKGTTIIYTSHRLVEEEGKDPRNVPFLKRFTVFSIHQCEGLPFFTPPVPWPKEERLDKLKAMAEGTKVPIRYGSHKASYVPSLDYVNMPDYGAFGGSDEAFASTLLHELSHATGAKHRLDRTMGKRFGDQQYAAEEVVAEMSSAFLCGHLGYKHEHDSAAYIDHWLKVMKSDNRAIITAASLASQAADWIRNAGLPQETREGMQVAA